MKIYQIDRTEVFSRLAKGESVYSIEKSSAQTCCFTDLREQTISEATLIIKDEECNFIVCE